MSLTPLRRDRLVTGPGPDGVGSKPPVRNGLPHMPEKSGMDAAPCAPLVADPAAGTNVCPQAGVAAAAANIANKRKARCLCTPTSRSWFVGEMVTSGVRACGAAPFQHRARCFLLARRGHPRCLRLTVLRHVPLAARDVSLYQFLRCIVEVATF